MLGMKSTTDQDYWINAGFPQHIRGFWMHYLNLVWNGTIVVLDITGATAFSMIWVNFACFMSAVFFITLGEFGVKQTQEDARESLRRKTKRALERRRTDTESFGYQVLSEFVSINGQLRDNAVFEPMVTIDMNNLTDLQATIIDNYFDSAEQIQGTFTDIDDIADNVNSFGEQMIRDSAMAAMSELLSHNATIKELGHVTQ